MFFELPSLEQIEEMNRQRSQAIEALEISDNSVKCQSCGMAVPLLRTSTKPRSNRIDTMQKRVKWIENYCRGNINRPYVNEVQQLKAELADLLEQEAKADALRSLPLYSTYLCLKYTKVLFYHPKAFADFAAPSSNACFGSFIP